MAGEIQATFEGTTGREPELGQTHGGKAALSVSVAVTRRVKRGDRFEDDSTTWVDCKVFGDQAENVAASLPKGTRVDVVGRLYEETFTRRDGTEGRKLVCDVERIAPSLRFATAQVMRRDARGGGGGQQGTQAGSWGQQASSWDTATPGQQGGASASGSDEGMPF